MADGTDGPITSPEQLDTGPVTSPSQVPDTPAINDASTVYQDPASGLPMRVAIVNGKPDFANGKVLGPDEVPADYYAPASSFLDKQSDGTSAISDAIDGARTAPQGQPASSSIGKVSVATKGIPGGARRVDDIFSQADAKASAELAPMTEERDKQLQQSRADYTQLGKAYDQEAAADVTHYQALKALNDRRTDFYQHAAELEQKASTAAHVETMQYMAQYKEQLAGVKQLMMMSGNPLSQMSSGQALGMGAAAFAQGFLAARGIKIDVSGQIDRWVERSMQEHQQQIANARASAGETLNLLQVARQNSRDDYEARERYRGYIISGMQVAIENEAARFGSDVAMARAKAQSAQLQISADTAERSIYDHYYQQAHTIRQDALHNAFDRGKLEIDQARLALEKARADAKTKPDENHALIPDAGDVKFDNNGKVVSGGKYKWKIDTKIAGPEGVKAVNTATQANDEFNQNLGTLRELRVAMGKQYGPDFWKKRNSEGYRIYDQERNLVVAGLQKAMTGMQATEQEQKRFLAMLQDDHWLEAGNNSALIDNLQRWGRQHYDSVMSNTVGVQPLEAGELDILDKAGNSHRPKVVAAPTAKALEDARFHGGDPIKTDIDEDTARAASRDPNESTAGLRALVARVPTADKESFNAIREHLQAAASAGNEQAKAYLPLIDAGPGTVKAQIEWNRAHGFSDMTLAPFDDEHDALGEQPRDRSPSPYGKLMPKADFAAHDRLREYR